MNKKSGILLFSVLFLLSLSVIYVFGDLSSFTLTKFGDGYETANWITNIPVTVNLTATLAAPNLGWNITNVSFYIDTNNVSWQWVALDGNYEYNDSADDRYSNVTYDGTGVLKTDWECINDTSTINCWNTTAEANLGSTGNTTFYVKINITGLGSDEVDTHFNASTSQSLDEGLLTNSSAYTSLYVDNQSPRLIEVNISDGNTTYHNATLGGVNTYFLNGPLYIEALIEDSQLEGSVIMAYNCNSTVVATSDGIYTEDVRAVTAQQGVGTIDQKGHFQSSRINCVYNDILGGNETFNVAFLINDTLNHLIQLNSTFGVDNPLNITMDDGELLPVIAKVNVTQTTISGSDGVTTVSKTLNHGSELDGSTDYLAANTVTFNVELTGGSKPDQVYIVWNDTGVDTTHFGPAVVGGSGAYFGATSYNLIDDTAALTLNNVSSTSVDSSSSANATTVVYSTTLNLAGNGTEGFAFWVYANNTGNNYTRLSGPHRFIVDGGAPSITMTPPTDLVISPRAEITYSCTMSDSLSGTNKIMWQLKKPSETAWTTKQTYADVVSGSDSITFTGDDTNLAGDYDVRCLAIDVIGNENTYTTSDTENFAVHYSTSEGGAGGAGGAVADIDLSTQEEVTITEKQGVISTFTLDGTTVHTIKIKTVDEVAGTVTIVIESDPITITLKIGETKEVDVDADGANDISVTLNKIINGAADLTTKRLTPLPEKAPTEEVPPTEKPAEEIPTAPEAASKTWLWILIIVIVVVIGVGYWFMKRK